MAPLAPARARAEKVAEKDFYGGNLTYPDWLLGDWKVSSELVSVEAPRGDEFLPEAGVKARARVGTRGAVVEYVKRYVRQGDRIVNDRAYTSRPLLASLGFDGPAESAEWGGENNPDVALLKLQRGSFAVRLNLRSILKAGVQPEGRTDLFNVSELFFAATEQPPEVIPTREVTKFKRVDELPGRPGVPGVQELLRVEVYSTLAGEADGQAVQEQAASLDLQTPVAIYKYRAVLLPTAS